MNKKSAYDLYTVQEIALVKKKCLISKHLINWLNNHGYRKGLVQDIVLALKDEFFEKTVTLENIPGRLADIYRMYYENEEWYIKIFLDEKSGEIVVRVWSCWPNGALH